MLDVRSIAYVTTVNLLIIALAFFVQWLRERDPNLRAWAIGFTVGAFGSQFSSMREFIPDFLSVAAGGALLFLAYVYTYIVLCGVFGNRPWRFIWLLPALTMALFSYFTVVDFKPFMWTLITGYTRFVICAVIVAELTRHRTQMSSYAFLLLTVSVGGMGLFMLARATIAIWIPQSYSVTVSSGPAITYFVTAACTLAMMLGLLAVHVDQLLKKLETTANTDVLTGLRNRRFFNELAHAELQRSIRERAPLWLLMIDIDHFKDINDTLGHAEGDGVLRQISQVLRDSLRSYDMVARYGGEEFCALLPNTDETVAQLVAQRLLRSVADLRVGPRSDHTVTISIGVACRSDADRNLEDLLKRADRALYDAKNGGRNCIAGFSGDRPTGPDAISAAHAA